ncbi:unnamed protein product [Cuscuta epithymum]|uniref:Scarecrow-like protein 8 n=1 Tax=Cuscuta epithymum TaxID=186058 RepID=A0AAV0EH59_9ASTE|nr:unnamed protein product [Cuscuta epithymum]
MSSGFPGSVQDLYGGSDGILNGRSVPINHHNVSLMQSGVHLPYGSQISGIVSDPIYQIAQRRSDLIAKRSFAESQQLQFLQQRQGALGLYLRNVKPRNYHHSSPISPLSPVDFSSLSSNSNSPVMNARYGVPVLQQFRPQNLSLPVGNVNFNGMLHSDAINPNFASGVSFQNSCVQNRGALGSVTVGGLETEKKMMNQLQELEKQLLDDNDEEEANTVVSAVTNSEWSETIQSLIRPTQAHGQTECPNMNHKQPISPATSSSTSSCASSMESPAVTCPKLAISEAATAVSEGKLEVASEILTRLAVVANVKGTAEQRLTAYMASALRSRVNPVEFPPPVMDLISTEQEFSTQKLYEFSPCFKLGFMAANLAILEAVPEKRLCKIHVVDFDIGEGGQYLHLLYALAARKTELPPVLKITTVTDAAGRFDKKFRDFEDRLQNKAHSLGLSLTVNIVSCSINELSRERLGVEPDEALVVNFAFKLYKLPDESVTTENLRDTLLRRVKGLSPDVVSVVEQELNGNTAPFAARVNEACGYYAALFDSLDATVPRDSIDRVRIEEGLGRKMANSVACEGRDRVERCEVLGKWGARLGMAGFNSVPMSQHVGNSLRSKLNSGTRGNPGFTISEQAGGGIGFGWMGRILAVASAWR